MRGAWEDQGTVYEDNLTRFFVDVPDLEEHRAEIRVGMASEVRQPPYRHWYRFGREAGPYQDRDWTRLSARDVPERRA